MKSSFCIILATVMVFMLAASASAGTVAYTTNATGSAGTGFNLLGALVLNNSSGAAATLTYIPNAASVSNTPSNVDFGKFTLVCSGCTAYANGTGTGTTFSAFLFELVITDVTDTATGTFIGTSSGPYVVYGDSSSIDVNWAPLQLGPGGSHATTGSFGPTIFTTTIYTGIVAPNSGQVPGQSTIQGTVDSTPEPATYSLLGGALLGLGLLRRKIISRP